MKKLLLLISSSLVFTGITQVFTPITNDSTFYGEASDSDFYGDIPLANDDGTSTSMYWEVDSVNLPSEWKFSVCDQDICYAIGTESVQWNLPSNGGYLNMHFYPEDQEGEGFVILKVNDSPDQNQTEYITFRGSAISSGVDNNSLEKILLYPNPARDYVNIQSGSPNTSYEMVNVLGKQVESGKLNQEGNFKINTSSMLNGVYFITFTEKNRKITKKLIVH
ncbi:MAG: T9SS type A sorting domain-containing protein [Brumimicrobium sp.]